MATSGRYSNEATFKELAALCDGAFFFSRFCIRTWIWKEELFPPKIAGVAIYKWVFVTLDCFIRRICPCLNTAEWSNPYSGLLYEAALSIFVKCWTLINFHVLRCNKCRWLGPSFFLSLFLSLLLWPLVRLATGTTRQSGELFRGWRGILLRWQKKSFAVPISPVRPINPPILQTHEILFFRDILKWKEMLNNHQKILRI